MTVVADKPRLLLAPHWRQLDELFAPADQKWLASEFEIIWGKDEPMPADAKREALAAADYWIDCSPALTAGDLGQLTRLKAVIEVSGAFPDTIDYAACAERGIAVLSCAPGFGRSVAEMGLAMLLAGARGLAAEHERFRKGNENWLSDNPVQDFTVYGARIGFVGFGSIARQTSALLAPFAPHLAAYDPWQDADALRRQGVEPLDLQALLSSCRAVFVTASPTAQNKGMLGATELGWMPDNALLVLISRAHLVDFDALVKVVDSGRLRAAIDVFPSEPVAPDARVRRLDNAILSPHRAAAVTGGRTQIGELVRRDLARLVAGEPARELAKADPRTIAQLAGIGKSSEVEDMAGRRG